MSNYQNNLNHWRHQAREEEDRKARMNMGIGNFLAEISSSESEEYQTRDPGYEPTQSVKDYSQPLYCKMATPFNSSSTDVFLTKLFHFFQVF